MFQYELFHFFTRDSLLSETAHFTPFAVPCFEGSIIFTRSSTCIHFGRLLLVSFFEQRFIVNLYWQILKTIPKNQKLKIGHMAPIGDGFVHLDMKSQRTFFRGSWNWPGNSFRKICLMTRNCKIWKKSGNRFRDLPWGVNLTDERSSAWVNFGTRIWHKFQTSAESVQITQPKWDFLFSTKSY